MIDLLIKGKICDERKPRRNVEGIVPIKKEDRELISCFYGTAVNLKYWITNVILDYIHLRDRRQLDEWNL